MEDKNFKKIANWFYNNKKQILKKASYPYFVSVSEQIRQYKELNNITTNLSNDNIARILTF